MRLRIIGEEIGGRVIFNPYLELFSPFLIVMTNEDDRFNLKEKFGLPPTIKSLFFLNEDPYHY